MTHAPFIIAAYAVALLTPLGLTIAAFARRAAARRVLAAVAQDRTAR